MKETTKQIIEAAMTGDATISDRQRDSVLAMLQKTTPPLVPLLLKQSEVAQLLSVTRQTVYNMVKQGLLNPVEITLGKKFRSHTRYGTEFIRNSGIVRYRRDEVLSIIRNT